MNIKNKALVVLSPLFLLCCTSLEPITIETSVSIISQTIYGPFSGNEGSYPITFSYHYEGFKAYLFERLTVWNENTGLIVSENPKHGMFGGNYTATLYFDTTVLKNFVDATLTFEIYVGNVRYYLNDFSITRYQPIDIITRDYRFFESAPSCFILDDALTGSFGDWYDFRLLDKVSNNKNYYDFDPRQLNIGFSSKKDMSYQFVDLYIEDPLHKFIYLNHTDDGYAYLSMRAVHEDDCIKFKFKEMKYDPISNQMFPPDHIGDNNLPKTTKFLFPLKEKDYFDKKKIRLEFIDVGFNHINITHELTYYSGDNLFGDCETSDYCVEGNNV